MKDEGQTSSIPLPPSSLNDRHTAVAPHDCFRALQTPLRFLKGIGPKRAAQLETVGLRTMEDLLYHLPFRYEDRRQLKTISEARIGNEESFVGNLVRLEKRFILKRRRSILTGILADESGALGLVWYHVTPYILKGLLVGQQLLVHGKVEGGLGAQKMLVHPEFEVTTSPELTVEPDTYRGHDGVREWWRTLLGVFPDFSIETTLLPCGMSLSLIPGGGVKRGCGRNPAGA